MTTPNAVQVPKKRKTVPSVRAPTDDKGSRATTTKTQKKPASHKKRHKAAKGGISKNRNKPADVVENVQKDASLETTSKSNNVSTVCT